MYLICCIYELYFNAFVNKYVIDVHPADQHYRIIHLPPSLYLQFTLCVNALVATDKRTQHDVSKGWKTSAVKCRRLESAQFTLPACLNKDRRPARLYSLWCCQRKTLSCTLLTMNKISLSGIREGALSVRDTALHADKFPRRYNWGDWWGARWNRGKLEEWTVWIVMRAWSIIYCDEQATQSVLDTKTDVMFAFAAFSSSITICTPSHNKWYHLCFPFLFLRDILRFVSVLQNIPICSNCLQWADEDINQICKYETV